MLVSLVTAISLALPASVVGAITSPAKPVLATAAPGQEDAPVFASVKVDADGFGEVGSTVSTRIAAEAEIKLKNEGIVRRAGVDDILVFLKITPPISGDEGYVVGIAVSRLGQPITETVEAECELCVEDELIALVALKLHELVPAMREHMAAVRAEAAKPEPVPEPEPEPEIIPPDNIDEVPTGMGNKGKAGIALVGLGAAGVIAGAVMAAKAPTQRAPDNGYELTQTQTPGYAALGIGGAFVVGGVVLFALDLRDRKKQRSERETVVAPVLGLGVAGLSWSGRF